MSLNPWKPNPWFESVAVAQGRAQKRLPKPVYDALLAGSERGQTISDNETAFTELALAPHVAGNPAERIMSTTVMGEEISLPVLISPTGVQAVHPGAEVAMARAAASRGTAMGLSNFASKPIEDVVAANPSTFFQMYWTGDRDTMTQRMERAAKAGARGLIATLDWSFSMGRDWGSPEIPERINLGSAIRLAPHVVRRPRWLWAFIRSGGIPDLTAPNLAAPDAEKGPTFFGAYYEWMTTPPPTWDDVQWMVDEWGGPLMLKGVSRIDDALKARDAGVTAISVSNHGGNNLDGTPAAIRLVKPISDAVGSDIEVLMDGGIRRGSDVVKAVALGARAVLIGRAPLWGLAANGEDGVGNVLDVIRSGIDSALLGMGVSSIHDLLADHLYVPKGFHRALGTEGRP